MELGFVLQDDKMKQIGFEILVFHFYPVILSPAHMSLELDRRAVKKKKSSCNVETLMMERLCGTA